MWLSRVQPVAVTIMAMPVRVAPRRPVRVYLKEHREHAGLSQQELGERLKKPVDKGTVSRWERSTRGLSLNVLSAYAEALGIPTPRLYHPPNKRESLDELVAGASEDVRGKVHEVVRVMVKPES